MQKKEKRLLLRFLRKLFVTYVKIIKVKNYFLITTTIIIIIEKTFKFRISNGNRIKKWEDNN